MDQEQRQLQHSPSVRDNLHQGSEVFSEHAGKQYTYNYAVFLIHCITCRVEDLDHDDGTALYTKYSKLTGQNYLLV